MGTFDWHREWLGQIAWYLGIVNGAVILFFVFPPKGVIYGPVWSTLYLGGLYTIWFVVYLAVFAFDRLVQRRFPVRNKSRTAGFLRPFLVSAVWAGFVSLVVLALVGPPPDTHGVVVLVSALGDLLLLGCFLAVIAYAHESDDDDQPGYTADRGYW